MSTYVIEKVDIERVRPTEDVIRLKGKGDTTIATYKILKGHRSMLEEQYVATIKGAVDEMNLLFYFSGRLRGTGIQIRMADAENNVIHEFKALITAEAKQTLETYLTPEGTAVLPVIEIPKGQEDFLTYQPIADGTPMADFQNERDGFHRYFTRATYYRMVKPRRKSPFTQRDLDESEVTFYRAKLDSRQQPFPVQHGGKRREKRATRRIRK